ncbi:hypothetical protein OG21DRAFT_1518130 [Imleria badia]|nr:hypothetical protein OG21DRAFT_1518130 [Imleria badia]
MQLSPILLALAAVAAVVAAPAPLGELAKRNPEVLVDRTDPLILSARGTPDWKRD